MESTVISTVISFFCFGSSCPLFFFLWGKMEWFLELTVVTRCFELFSKKTTSSCQLCFVGGWEIPRTDATGKLGRWGLGVSMMFDLIEVSRMIFGGWNLMLEVETWCWRWKPAWTSFRYDFLGLQFFETSFFSFLIVDQVSLLVLLHPF